MRPAVAASIFPVYDLVRRVAGEHTAVALVLPPGHMDHGFDPRPQDLVRLSAVDLAFGVGLGLDPWLARVVSATSDQGARVVELGPDMDPRPMSGQASALDPHVFLDPLRAAESTRLIAKALSRRDPEGAAGYEARGAQVAEDLRALHAELQKRSERWAGRAIVTFHGSFHYFADRYGLRVAAVVEAVPGREPTARDLGLVKEAVRREKAEAVFSEPQLDPRPAQLIAAESGLPHFVLDPVGGGPGALTYEAWLRGNADVLDQALR